MPTRLICNLRGAWMPACGVAFMFLSTCWAPTPTGGAESDQPLPDPRTLRRVLLPPEKLQAELARVHQGMLVRLSREEFEAKVKSAIEADDTLKNPPRLIEAQYRATLADTALV